MNASIGNHPSREDAVAQIKALYRSLWSDVTISKELRQSSDSGFARRTLIRSYFAMFDGVSHALRQITLVSCGRSQLTPEVYDMLAETKRFLSAKKSIVQSIRYYAVCHRDRPYEVNCSDTGWNAMTKAIPIRDRITHPKSVEQLEVSDDEVAVVLDAGIWWADTIRGLLTACEIEDQLVKNSAISPQEGA